VCGCDDWLKCRRCFNWQHAALRAVTSACYVTSTHHTWIARYVRALPSDSVGRCGAPAADADCVCACVRVCLCVCVRVCWRCYDMIRDSSKSEFHCVGWQQACRYIFIFTFIFVENSITTVIRTVYTQPPRLPGLVDDSGYVHICRLCALLGDRCWWWRSLGDMSTADDVITMCARSRCDVIIFCCLLAVTWYTHALTGQWRHHACPTCDDTNNNNSLRLELREIIAGM